MGIRSYYFRSIHIPFHTRSMSTVHSERKKKKIQNNSEPVSTKPKEGPVRRCMRDLLERKRVPTPWSEPDTSRLLCKSDSTVRVHSPVSVHRDFPDTPTMSCNRRGSYPLRLKRLRRYSVNIRRKCLDPSTVDLKSIDLTNRSFYLFLTWPLFHSPS